MQRTAINYDGFVIERSLTGVAVLNRVFELFQLMPSRSLFKSHAPVACFLDSSAVVAIMYATGQVKTHVRRRWFVIGVTLLIALIAILVFPRWAE